MAEAFGVAAGVIAVLQITSSVLSVCYDYKAAIRDAPWDLSQIQTELEDLRNVLQKLEPLAKHAEISNPAQLQTLNLLCVPLQSFLEAIKKLKEKLKPPEWMKSWGPKRKALVQSLRWPLKEAETKKALERISRFKETLQLAFHADQTTLALEIQKLSLSTYTTAVETKKDVLAVQDTFIQTQTRIYEIGNSVAGIRWEAQRDKIYHWLSAPDPSTNHNRARGTCQVDTGLWFVRGAFNDWIKKSQVMWLHGKAGCGKTVLSSTIVTEVRRICFFEGVGVAYFYFDFNDIEKQSSDKMVCSIIKQLVSQSTKKCVQLESLFSKCNNGAQQPNSDELMPVLEEMMKAFDKAYIVLDALDECSDRQALLRKMKEIENWQLSQLHVLLTSRRLADIEEALKSMTDFESRISIQNAAVDADIEIYVNQRLQKDQNFKRWRNHHQAQKEIKNTLKKKADGMFRWAACQLDALQDCRDLRTLRKTLASLPKTLDETYARILCNIPEDYNEHALRILQWLAYSRRPLKIKELAEVVAVNPNEGGDPWFDHEARFPEPRDILTICPGLMVEEPSQEDDEKDDEEDDVINDVITDDDDDDDAEQDGEQDDEENDEANEDENDDDQDQEKIIGGFSRDDSSEVIKEIDSRGYSKIRRDLKYNNIIRLAHFSVKEYLLSERIRDQTASSYAIKASKYAIQEISAHKSIASQCLAYLLHFEQYGVIRSYRRRQGGFISGYPLSNYAAEEWIEHVNSLGKDLGSIETLSLELFLVCKKAYWKWEYISSMNFEPTHGSPLYNASLFGAFELVQSLLKRRENVNAHSGYYHTALQAASSESYIEIVQLLLNHGADVNAQGGRYHTALQAASFRENVEIVQLLLNHEADVNAQGGSFHTALQAASHYEKIEIVQLLLNHEADVNAQGGVYHTALQTASFHENVEIVQLLLNHGADVNAQGGRYHTALQAASTRGNVEVVQLLLNHGADVNAPTVLQAASLCGKVEIVQLLLNHGADVNTQGEFFHTALQTASFRGNVEIVQLLLNHGADVNAQGGRYHTALHAASSRGHEAIVIMLLNNEADFNISGPFFEKYDHQGGHGTALHAASIMGQTGVIKLLLEYGADVNAVGIFHATEMTALQLASQKGVNVLWEERYYQPSDEKYEETVQLLQSAQDSQRIVEESRDLENTA